MGMSVDQILWEAEASILIADVYHGRRCNQVSRRRNLFIDRFCIALFSALQHTHCALCPMWFWMSDWSFLTLSLPYACRGVTRKTTHESAKPEIIQPFLREHLKGLLLKRTVLKANLWQDHQVYRFGACMFALFSPEILQAGAVKGLYKHHV